MRWSRQTLFNTLVVTALAGIGTWNYTHRPPKLAYVESARVLEAYKPMQQAKLRYQEQVQSWQANLDTLKQVVQGEIDDYNRLRPTLPASERRLREERLGERQRQYLGYRKALADKAAEEDARLTGQVVHQADSLMRLYGEVHGYDIVFAATEAGTVVYAEQRLNITNQLIEYINSKN